MRDNEGSESNLAKMQQSIGKSDESDHENGCRKGEIRKVRHFRPYKTRNSSGRRVNGCKSGR